MTHIVKALIVTDSVNGGGFLSGGADRDFHLGEFVNVLNATAWDGFSLQITRAHRRNAPGVAADIVNFTFSDASLVGFDMVLMFAIERDGAVADITDSEVAAIARFMDQGGGVFATGDHEDLGAAMCRKIPRVSSMRRWYWPNPGPNGELVAPIGTPISQSDPAWPALKDRHDTLRSGTDSVYDFDDQSDRWGQPIEPTWYDGGRVFRRFPHPLLCSPAGVVTRLPDHPHEGICEIPANLTRTVNVGGYSGLEYPILGGANLAPEVVAYASVIGGHATVNPNKPPTVAKTFGVIGAWDGHRVDRGRVVVDATWHHFFNVNLTGDPGSPNVAKRSGFYAGTQPNPDYEQIKAYFRNIVYWLIPKDRTTLWFHSLAQSFQRSAYLFEEVPRLSATKLDLRWVLHLAGLADHYFANARGACWRYFLPDIPELYHEFSWWKIVMEQLNPWVGEPWRKRLPIHPMLTVDLSVLADVAFGSVVAVFARWAQDNPDLDVDSEVVAGLTKELQRILSQVSGELREHLDEVASDIDDVRTALG